MRKRALSRVWILSHSFVNELTSPDTSQAGSTCSPDFLKAILGNLELINVAYGFEGVDVTILEECLAATSVELKRLQKHPELYPNTTAQQDFLRLVRKACKGIAITLQGRKAWKRVQKVYRRFLEDCNEAVVLPNRDEHRTPWQQFLHNQAPGSGVGGSQTTGSGCAYLFPPGGVRLVFMMYLSCQSTVHEIRAVGENSYPHSHPCLLMPINVAVWWCRKQSKANFLSTNCL